MASRGFKRRIGACAFFMGCAWQSAAVASDTLLIHGHIYTGNRAAPWATAIAVKDARIEAVGSDADILKHRGGHARVVDLHGQTVIPGIVDSHTHMLYGAFALHGLNLSTPESSITPDKPDLLVERLRAYAAEHPKDAVLFGRADFSTVPPDHAVEHPARPRGTGPAARDPQHLGACAMAQHGCDAAGGPHRQSGARRRRGARRGARCQRAPDRRAARGGDADRRPRGACAHPGRGSARDARERLPLLEQLRDHERRQRHRRSGGDQALRDTARSRHPDRAHAHRLRRGRGSASPDARVPGRPR